MAAPCPCLRSTDSYPRQFGAANGYPGVLTSPTVITGQPHIPIGPAIDRYRGQLRFAARPRPVSLRTDQANYRSSVTDVPTCNHRPVDYNDDGEVAWDQVAHAYGPAVEVPGWISGLRDPSIAASCLSELYGSITHQGTRYSATPLAIPYLIEAAHDPAVPDRAGVIFLIQFCATGNSGDCLDWRCQRDLQTSPHERASWDAVAAGHERLHGLLADPDRAVAGAALTLLAWTGDASNRVLTAIRQALDSEDDRDQCNGWLSSVVLGQLPPGQAAPTRLNTPGGPGRFGAAVASIRFGGSSTPPEAVDELCSVFASIESGEAVMTSEFLMAEEPAWVAALALATTPAHLRDHANAQLRTAIARGFVLGTSPLRAYLKLNLGESRPPVTADALPAEAREALLKLLDPLNNWRNAPTIGHRIYELEEYSLPGMPDHLATWLQATPS